MTKQKKEETAPEQEEEEKAQDAADFQREMQEEETALASLEAAEAETSPEDTDEVEDTAESEPWPEEEPAEEDSGKAEETEEPAQGVNKAMLHGSAPYKPSVGNPNRIIIHYQKLNRMRQANLLSMIRHWGPEFVEFEQE